MLKIYGKPKDGINSYPHLVTYNIKNNGAGDGNGDKEKEKKEKEQKEKEKKEKEKKEKEKKEKEKSEKVKLTKAFNDNGFTKIIPESYWINSSQKFSVQISFDKSKNMHFVFHLFYLQGNEYKKQTSPCILTKGDGKARINCITNYKGEYRFDIYGAERNAKGVYAKIAEYKIKSASDANPRNKWPQTSKLFTDSDIEIIQQFFSPLKRGGTYTFKYKTHIFKNLYLMNGNNNFIKMNKKGNEFTKKVTVKGNEIQLCTLKDKSFKTLLKYTT